MELLLIVSIVLIGFFVATLFSILGLGGAIFYTPLFYWLGLPLLTAIPMALLLNAITTASASLTYLKLHLVKKEIALPVILTSMLGAVSGSYIAPQVDAKVLIMLLSAVLLFASMRLLFFNDIGFAAGMTEKKKIAFCSVAGFLIGIISSLVGIGGGTFVVPLLLVSGLETKNAVATSSFIVTFISLSGFLGHLSFGQQQIDTSVLLFAGAAAFIGAQAGSRFIFERTSSRTIELLFAGVIVLVVGKLMYGLV